MKRALLAMLLVCGCASERRDVAALCDAPSKLDTSEPAMTATRLSMQLQASVRSAQGKELLARLLAAPATERHALLTDAARSHGLATCPLAELWAAAPSQ